MVEYNDPSQWKTGCILHPARSTYSIVPLEQIAIAVNSRSVVGLMNCVHGYPEDFTL